MQKSFLRFLFFLIGLPSFLPEIHSQTLSFEPRGIGGGGALFFPKISPHQEEEFYVACDLSAMFHSKDLGLNYTQIPFQSLQVFNTSTFEFTANPKTAYSIFNDGNEGFPVVTQDGAETWDPLPGYDVSSLGSVYRLVANPTKTGELLINNYNTIFLSQDAGKSLQVIKVADDNGSGLILGGAYWEGDTILIGTNDGVLASWDHGTTFAKIEIPGLPAGQKIWQFGGAKNGNQRVWAVLTASTSNLYNGVMPWDYYQFVQGVYVLNDLKGSWTSSMQGMDLMVDFPMYLALSGNNTEQFFLGGNDSKTGGPLVLRTQDGGLTWKKVFLTNNNQNITTAWEGFGGDKNWSWSETCFGITTAPKNADIVLFSNYSNIQISEDGGNSWRQAYVSAADAHPAGQSTPKKQAYHSIGLENTTSWQVFWKDASTLFGCFSDIGCIASKDGGISWGYQYDGFSVNSCYRMENGPSGQLFAACSGIHDIYQSTRLTDAYLDATDNSGKIVFSKDGGMTWSDLHVFKHPVYWLAFDAQHGQRMYASVIHYGGGGNNQQGGIYRTDQLLNGSNSNWTLLPQPPRTQGHPACLRVLKDGKLACTFSGRRNSSGAFTNSSGVFLYDPESNTWSDRSSPSMYYWTKDLVIDPADSLENTWYACVWSGWGGAPNGLGGLYRTKDRGLNWKKISGVQFLFDRVSSITVDPLNSNHAWLTTETKGLWVTNNLQDDLPTWKQEDAYPYRQPERVFFNPYDPAEMWVSSFGNGMRVRTQQATPSLEHPFDASVLRAAPVPFQDLLRIESSDENGPLQVFHVSGRCFFLADHPSPSFELDTADWPSGLYVIRQGKQVLKAVKTMTR